MGDYQWRYSGSEEHLEGIAVRCEGKQFARPHISFFDWRNEALQEQRFTKRDWTLFRSKIGDWQEAYMGRLCGEYIELLSGDGDPSEKFWQLEKRIRSDKRNPGVQLEMTRTNFIYNIISLISNDVISMKDLEDFSDKLKETVRVFLERQSRDYSDED